jgi:hypothetical protein
LQLEIKNRDPQKMDGKDGTSRKHRRKRPKTADLTFISNWEGICKFRIHKMNNEFHKKKLSKIYFSPSLEYVVYALYSRIGVNQKLNTKN